MPADKNDFFLWNGSRESNGADLDHMVLAMVIEETVGIMRADSAILTLDDARHGPIIVYQTPGSARHDHELMTRLDHTAGSTLPYNRLTWAHTTDRSGQMVMIPIERVPGHSRLVITLLFDAIDEETRERVERVYRERRPFAVGYFRLWQLNRLNMRRYRALEAALDCTEIGVFLVDSSSRILFANQSAKDILAAGDGLSQRHGTLHATNLRDAVNLAAALSHIAVRSGKQGIHDAARTQLLAFQRCGAPALVASIVPAQTSAIEVGDVAATIYVVDPRLNLAKDLAPICELYGLSPVETGLVCQLAAGEPMSNAADKMRIKEQTARGYLKNIYIKTDTNRQSALIALMLSSLMRMKSDVLPETLTADGAERALTRSLRQTITRPTSLHRSQTF